MGCGVGSEPNLRRYSFQKLISKPRLYIFSAAFPIPKTFIFQFNAFLELVDYSWDFFSRRILVENERN